MNIHQICNSAAVDKEGKKSPLLGMFVFKIILDAFQHHK